MKTEISIILLFSLVAIVFADKHEKYSRKTNEREFETYNSDFRNLQKPFRVAKLNLLWSKAVHRLTEPKLKSLFAELKIHDKEELNFKHIKSDKPKQFDDGMKEAELRKKLIGIMSTYGMLEVMDIEDVNNPELYKHHKPTEGKVKNDNYKNKSLFKDKKLNKLWERAEISGTFSPEEMDVLKEEFLHHEEKVNFYYNLLENLDNVKDKKDDEHHKSNYKFLLTLNFLLINYFLNFHSFSDVVNEEELDIFNEVALSDDDDDDQNNNNNNKNIRKEKKQKRNKHDEYIGKANEVREKHREIRDNIDRLERKVNIGSNSSDFIEPKVQGLWRIAQESNFTAEQLASIKIELHHFESRFLKLRTMHAEHALTMEKYKHANAGDKHHDKVSELESKIIKQSRKVEKLQEDLEKRLNMHSEL
jgi:hypothetical protein